MHQALLADKQLPTLGKLKFPADLADVQESTQGVLAHLDQLVSQMNDKTEIAKGVLARIAYEWLDVTLPEAVQFAAQRLQNFGYATNLRGASFTSLVERLALDVPPNEVGKWPKLAVGDWRDGLLASWLVAISKSVEKKGTPAKRLEDLGTVHKLALKGVEYGVIQKQCTEHLAKKGTTS
jgi:hypothetical protein